MIVKIVCLGIVGATTIWAAPQIIAEQQWLMLAFLLVSSILIFVIYLPANRRLPGKYMIPGLILLAAFQVFPVVLTAVSAFTNYGDGHRVTKEEAITSLEGNSVQEVPGAPRYKLSVASEGSVDSGPFVFFLTQEDGTVQIGDENGLEAASADLEIEKAITGKVTSAKGWNIFGARDVNKRSAEIDKFTVPVGPPGVYIKKLGLNEAFQGKASISYDPATGLLTDSVQNKTYRADDELGSFVNVDDPTDVLATGWRVGVGFDNFTRVFTDPQIRGPFFEIFVWTFVFAFMSVLTTFVLGLALALVMNHPRLRGQKIYRSLLLIPYAVPAFVALPVWASMFNKDYGLINNVLNTNLDWFGDPMLAKIAVILTNLWLGFPYMFLVITGSLQAIPGDLTEAATVDGASSRTAFRTVVFPLLLVSVAPLLISSFAFNFNNFNVIQLLTEGGPFPADNPTAGGTDILISYTYRLAFGAQGAQFGFAAAISMVIFFLVATISALSFRRTKVLEELN